MTSTEAQRATQEAIFTAVAAGQTVFTKAPTGWMVVGPAAVIKVGKHVLVTKKDGSTSEVRIVKVNPPKSARGVNYAVATFAKLPPADRVTPAAKREGYTTVHSAAFGQGRRYHAQPGATQYDDGSGTYRVQIWDNA